ncbi:metalloprotease TIKI1-like [Clavelina lepadiformis]|uniref:metalloprotease TIKI1-like n=1 Tax=Clavelina lepadiformis TaxID=159417 RepID=UPI0040438BEF
MYGQGFSRTSALVLFYIVHLAIIVNGKVIARAICKEEVRKSSFLWEIKRSPPAYLFGTIHVPYTRVWDFIPKNSKKAFKDSKNIFFELDLTDAPTISNLTRCQMLPRGTDLRQILPTQLFTRLKQHLEYVKKVMPDWVTSDKGGKSIYADYLFEAIVGNWERMKPVWVMLMINSLTEADVRSRNIPVLDLYLARQAERMGKKIGAVEKVDEQCQPLNGLNMSQVIFALNHTLTIQEQLRHGKTEVPFTTDDLINQYNCGELDSAIFDKDTTQVPKMANNSGWLTTHREKEAELLMEAEIDSYFKNELIYRRNRRMAERVRTLLEEHSGESFFFAFGTGHFLGNGSVISFLQQHEYEIENVTPDNFESGLSLFNYDFTSTWLSERPHSAQGPRSGSRRSRKNRHRASKKRGKSRQSRRRKKKKQKQKVKKHRFRDLWMPLDKSDHPTPASGNLGFFFESPQISVINRYPTVLPPKPNNQDVTNKNWHVWNQKQRRKYNDKNNDSRKQLREFYEQLRRESKTNPDGNCAFSSHRPWASFKHFPGLVTYLIIAAFSLMTMHINALGQTPFSGLKSSKNLRKCRSRSLVASTELLPSLNCHLSSSKTSMPVDLCYTNCHLSVSSQTSFVMNPVVLKRVAPLMTTNSLKTFDNFVATR